MVDLAIKGLTPIKELLEDDKPISRLLALNLILVFFSLGLIISFYLGTKLDNFAGIIMLLISFIFAAIISGVYGFFVNLLSREYKIKAVRASLFILFITIPIAVLGLAYNFAVAINLALLLLLLQLITLIILSLFIPEEKIQPNIDLWVMLGKANTALGLISSLITIGGLIFKFLK